jgi:hypothetical protein
MSEMDDKKLIIIGTLKGKSILKQKVYDNTLEWFGVVKDILKTLARDVNTSLGGFDSRMHSLKLPGIYSFSVCIQIFFSSTGNILPGKHLISRRINSMHIPE